MNPASLVANDSPVASATDGTREFFSEFFRRLEQGSVPYAILHGYEEFPERIASDVDYVVGESDRTKAAELLAALARERRWVVVQVRQHELTATYCVAIDPENAENHLKLDGCSHFAKNRCLLVQDTVLLANRRRHPAGFFVPAPASEFIYVLAKALAKQKSPAQVLPRLRELWRLDPAGAQRAFDDLVGKTAQTLEQWLADESHPWDELATAMHARKAYGPAMRIADALRRIRRATRPVGLHIAALGPDGAGKSTLIQNMERLLAPCFLGCRVFKFRPDIFNQITRKVDPTPHDRPPRSTPVSWAKVIYYFGDWWIGLFKRLLPILRGGGLVLFDRNFDDLAVDQRRYLVQGSEKLALLLRKFVPRAAVTFILEADPRVIHARKPELPVEELERQRQAYRRLAAGDSRLRLVSGEEPPGEVARKVCRDVITFLAYRERLRNLPLRKRLFDFAVAATALTLLSPLLLVVALLVRLKLGSPVIFTQRRPGLAGWPFRICKFRTMTDARDASGKLLPDAERLTRFGRLLRSTSLDELPELLNILKGEMSLVGPRPLLMSYLPLYSPEQMRRHEVLPGVTGWAQVNGRNAMTWTRKFELDVWYVLNGSLWLDIKIIGLTFWKVLAREGINQPGFTTSAPFLGEREPDSRDRRGSDDSMNHRRVTTVLVTGVGDTVGQALIKSARHSSLPCRVLGTDRDGLSVGLRWVDKGFILPHCHDRSAYLAGVRRICKAEGVDLILPGSEKELLVLAEDATALQADTGAVVVASPAEVLRVALDKLETCRFLEAAGLNFPQYARPECEEEVERLIKAVGFPLLVKPRHGTGARGISKILCRKDLEEMRMQGAGMVLQEYLQPDDAEYSVEVYTLRNGTEPGAISYWRGQLIGGDTSKARIAPNTVVEAEARAVARALRTRGPCNVQLRLTARGPVTFEINPRFSGGVSVRAHFGYNEVEMAIRDLVLDQPLPQLKLTSGEALRFWDEMYIDDETKPLAVQ